MGAWVFEEGFNPHFLNLFNNLSCGSSNLPATTKYWPSGEVGGDMIGMVEVRCYVLGD